MHKDNKKRKAEANIISTSGRENAQKMERAQIWSIDVLLAVVIFISIIIIFYATISSNEPLSVKELQNEAERLRVELERNQNLGFINKDSIDPAKLDNFAALSIANYDSVKERLGVRGDFCIYFEDENGNLMLVRDNRSGIGSASINISDTPCGSKVW
jgi:hypothetical protein